MAKVYIELEAKDRATSVVQKMDKNTQDAFSRLKQHARASTTSMGSSIDKLKKHWVAFSAAAVAGVLVLRKAVMAVMARVKEWINLSKVQELAEISLAAALKAAGEFTDILNNKYQEFASWIQKVTKYGDEQVLGLMALIKNLGVSTDKVKEATKMAIGLATATGRDVSSMAQYVALAIKGEFTMLRRYIPALRSTTDATEQLRIVTEFAARGFKVAQEMTKSFSITVIQLANLWADLKEKLGDFATRNKVIMEQLLRAKDYIIELNDELQSWLTNNQELINQKTHEAIQKITIAVKALIWSLKTLNKLKNIFRDIFLHMSIGINQLALLAETINKLRPAKIEGQGIIRMKIEKPELPLLEDATPKATKATKEWYEEKEKWAEYMADKKKSFKLLKQDQQSSHDFALLLAKDEVDKRIEQTAFMSDLEEKALQEELTRYETVMAANEKYMKQYKANEEAKAKASKEAAAAMLASWTDAFKQLSKGSDTAFRFWKALAVTEAIISTYAAAQAAYEAGMKTGGPWAPVIATVYATAAVVAGMARVAAIRSQEPATMYEKGGVIDRPTYAYMGERGTEAVVPLARTKTGDLGVKTVGTGSNIEINMINQSGHPLQATQSGRRQEQGKYIIDVIVKELQRGRTLRQTIRSTI